jgi:4-amino-4-deoxy-L-arabinose transferase-like glycosyltransferase
VYDLDVRLLAIGVVVIVAGVTPLLLVGTGGHARRGGDEAIYAQIGREAADDGRWATPTWQNVPQLGRPHGIGWTLGVARLILGKNERAVRWPLALVCALEVGLLLLLGARLFSPAAGIAAAGLLVTADLFVGYARYLESEPFLSLLAIASFLFWERARQNRRWILAWGACLGASLMIKQFIGALPLLPLFVDLVQKDRPRVRGILPGIAVAAALCLPWHLFMLVKFGRPFVGAYLLGNLVHRSSAAMLQTTRPSFYLRELWRSEGLGAIVAAVAVVWIAVCARKRSHGSLLILGWALPPLVVFSISASRYDYYLLLIYPALALAAGSLLTRLTNKLALRQLLIAALVVTAAAVHLPRNLDHFDGDDELRALVGGTNVHLYLYNTHGYSARWYIDSDVTTLLESEKDEALAESLRDVMPSSTLYAPDLAKTIATLPRPFALVMPRARANLLPSGLELVKESKHYFLLRAR